MHLQGKFLMDSHKNLLKTMGRVQPMGLGAPLEFPWANPYPPKGLGSTTPPERFRQWGSRFLVFKGSIIWKLVDGIYIYILYIYHIYIIYRYTYISWISYYLLIFKKLGISMNSQKKHANTESLASPNKLIVLEVWPFSKPSLQGWGKRTEQQGPAQK